MSFSTNQLVSVYNHHVLPKFTFKNKAIAITAAITMSMTYFILKTLRPPKHLRHIPHISPLSLIRSLFIGEPYWNRAYRVYLPIIDDPQNHNGLYLEYGRTGWEIFICNPQVVKEMLLKQETFPKLKGTDIFTDTLFDKFMGGPNIGLLDGEAWKAQRKMANPAFHRAMPVQLFGELAVDMFQVMETMGDTINVSKMMEGWTLQVIGKAGFGFDFNAIKDPNSPWVRTYNICNEGFRNTFFFVFPVFDKKYLWMFPKRVYIHQEMDRFRHMLQDVIDHKRLSLKDKNYQNDALEENERDLLTLLIESEIRGEGVMTDEELMSNLRFFFVAGHDTTSSTLSFAIHYLAKHPEIQQKAREETIRILGDEPVDILPVIGETKQMTYINQIMLETLRINGPLPSLVPRCASRDVELFGTFIPKGTPINANIFNIHHSEKLWKDSHVFNPDRFENEESKTLLMAFGYGGRQCIGMTFSLIEQRVMLSMLLRKFTWSTPENSIHKDGVLTNGYLMLSPQDLDITFKKRY
ncbi:cytochrome P450 [Mucor mucedo]|uniref:cytochrome P450 n=1 Tax=Mucor mucedo TaxID=29922 RepID=UPI002220F1B6|nr:cytochrome P450 [Mucor mucedo]KAI7883814.1 cytochrome P450 [Mucor mucedo]